MNKTQDGISVITCTKRSECMMNLFNNFQRQQFVKKELILILNHDKLDLAKYKKLSSKLDNIQVYQLPEKLSLGRCLNFSVSKTNYSCVAKFDDDDYYAHNYLTDSLQAMQKNRADIVGKRAHFMYLEGSKVLLLRYDKDEFRFVPLIQGATLFAKRAVFDKVSFPDRNQGECIQFCKDSRAKGFKIYAGGRFNFVAVRRKHSKNHTWIVSDRRLLSGKAKQLHVKDYRKYVTRANHVLSVGSVKRNSFINRYSPTRKGSA